MNRIILIGNGFDLAHGLKTSYNDFIDWIVESKHELIKRNHGEILDQDIEYKNGTYTYYKAEHNVFKKNFYNESELISYKNIFLQKLIYNRYVENWSDIETLFYDELNVLLDDNDTTNKEIEKFNSDFQRIIDLLEEYLSIVIDSKNEFNKYVFNRIDSLLKKNRIVRNELSIDYLKVITTRDVTRNVIHFNLDQKIEKCLVLDFNYTQTIKSYLTNDFEYINIHGILNDLYNPMIFGFGDELDENYNKIEKSRLTDVLKFIKSINYLKTSNYRDVLNFLELDNFQVFIWGHSCGTTDRTLLNYIFEHNNCVGIKPYYYKKYNEEIDSYSDNYIEIVSNIARNFTDKNKLRDRVVNYQFCEPLIK